MTFSPKPIKDANEEKQPCRVLFYVLDHSVATMWDGVKGHMSPANPLVNALLFCWKCFLSLGNSVIQLCWERTKTQYYDFTLEN